MNHEMIEQLGKFASDLVAYVAHGPGEDRCVCTQIVMGEMADGSGRSFALVTTLDEVNELEQVFRICSPAPADAPAWAHPYKEWLEEVRLGDGWMRLHSETA